MKVEYHVHAEKSDVVFTDKPSALHWYDTLAESGQEVWVEEVVRTTIRAFDPARHGVYLPLPKGT